jgi:hypothetical protein
MGATREVRTPADPVVRPPRSTYSQQGGSLLAGRPGGLPRRRGPGVGALGPAAAARAVVRSLGLMQAVDWVTDRKAHPASPTVHDRTGPAVA